MGYIRVRKLDMFATLLAIYTMDYIRVIYVFENVYVSYMPYASIISFYVDSTAKRFVFLPFSAFTPNCCWFSRAQF